MKHEGQIGSVETDMESGTLHGKLLYIDDLVTYEASTLADLRAEFESAVEDYLADCAELNIEPNRPFKGSFNVRPGRDLHKALVFKAAELGISLNEAVSEAIDRYVNGHSTVVRHLHEHTVVQERVFEVDEPERVEADYDMSFIWGEHKGEEPACH